MHLMSVTLAKVGVIYQDKRTPRLSPAYDILMTSVYVENERHFALNLTKNKDWYLAEMKHFEQCEPYRVCRRPTFLR